MFLIVLRSVTSAQRANRLLRRNGILSDTARLPAEARDGKGCGWGVEVKDLTFPEAFLRGADFEIAGIFERKGGVWRDLS